MDSNESLFDLQVDEQSLAYLNESGRWARFIAIIGFVFCGLMVLGGLSMGALMGTLSQAMGNLGPFPSAFIAFYFICVAILSFFPCLYLFRFGTQVKTAIANKQQDKLSVSLRNLKSYFKFVGVLLIIVICLYVLGFIGVIIGSIVAR